MTFLDQMCDMTGYRCKTTFFQDFSIAEQFGYAAIKDTFRRAFKAWKHSVVYLTELVMVLNWKQWEWHAKGREDMTRLYYELWTKADGYAVDNLKGEDAEYFYATTD